jgi:uncharacterized membrane protein
MVQDKSTRPGWGRIALIASFGMNLFFMGLFVGGQLGPGRVGYGPPPPPLPPLHLMADRLRGTLSEEGLAKIEALIGELDSRFARRISAVEQPRQRIKSLLTAESFDAAAFAAALGDISIEAEKDRADVNRRIAEVMSQLSRQDRTRLGEVTLSFPPPGRGPGPMPRFP